MEPLKIFATFHTGATLPKLRALLHKRGWQQGTQNNEWSYGPLNLIIESSGDADYLIRGEMEPGGDLAVNLAPLLSAFDNAAAQYSVDIFEEDGRLVRRIQG